ncbi:MAG TPA: ABC transporter permease [Cellvibrio sp.]|nr:ABC transporter permease [Cellvibrio sp.]
MKYLYFIWKNLGRKKMRTLLTILSITIAFLLFGLLRTLGSAFEMGTELSGEDRLATIHKISLIQPLPFSHVTKIQAVEGVEAVTHASWFGGYYQDPKNQFAQFAVEGDKYFSIYNDLMTLPPEQMDAWMKNRIGAVVGRATADRFGWKVGDRVPIISTIFPQKNGSYTWEFEIEGIYDVKDKRADSTAFLFHYDYYDEAKSFDSGTVGWIVVKVENPAESARIAAEIDSLFANSFAETKTSSEKDFAASFAKQFGDIGLITSYILGAVFFTMLLVAGNTMAQSVRERIPELAILKTLGFSDIAVLNMVLAESLLISCIGGALGLGAAWLVTSGMADQVAAFMPGFVMSASVVTLGIVVMLLLGLLTGILPALQGMRLSIVNALGRR